MTAAWGETRIITRGRIHAADQLPALIARRDSVRLGLLTFRIAQRECEIVSLNSTVAGVGVGWRF